MRMRYSWVLALAASLLLDAQTPAMAGSLAGQLHSFITQGRAGADTLTPLIKRLASEGTDFPVPPTTPGYVFTYNPATGIFERYPGSLGPVFLERVETLGQNHAAFGISYLYGNVNQFDGEDLAQGNKTAIGETGIEPGKTQSTTVGTFLDKFRLPTNKINFAASYGITDQWDVGLLLPLVVTTLQVQGQKFATGFKPVNLAPLDATSTGIGDLLLRTKYRFGYLFDWGVAGGFVLRFPTGDANDFHGLGDWTVQPQLIISRAFGVQDVHANLGMEFNVSNGFRTRALYGIGATLSLPDYRWLALLIDFIGNSALDNEQFVGTVRFQPGVQPVNVFAPLLTSAVKSGPNTVTTISTIPRADQVNASVGLKFEIWGNALGYVNAIVPLTRQGLQANVISAGGIEYSF
jgi:hypothetical protein